MAGKLFQSLNDEMTLNYCWFAAGWFLSDIIFNADLFRDVH